MACLPFLAACSATAPDERLEVQQEAQCTSHPHQNVESYDGTLGPSVDFVQRHERPVAKGSGGIGTGTLIANNLILTNNHTWPQFAGDWARFGFQLDASGNAPSVSTVTANSYAVPNDTDADDGIGSIVERDTVLDYAIIRVSGSPGLKWGVTRIDPRAIVLDEDLTMIEHGNDEDSVDQDELCETYDGALRCSWKKIAAGTADHFDPPLDDPDELPQLRSVGIETHGGSSGSSLLDATGAIVALHNGGGGCKSTSTTMQQIDEGSSILGGADSLWRGQSDKTFLLVNETQIVGSYVPIAGNFNGDAHTDILLYGPGAAADRIAYGESGGLFNTESFNVSGYYVPVTGDFNCDGEDDVFMHGPGSDPDRVFLGSPSGLDSSAIVQTVDGSYQPVAGDFDGAGCDDIYWYSPSGSDRVWYFTTPGAGQSLAHTSVTPIDRGEGYRLLAGQFDAGAPEDIFFYGPGTTADFVLRGASNRTFSSQSETVNGHFDPVAGDFDGNGRTDVFFYEAAGEQSVWYLSTGGSWTFSHPAISGIFTPVAGDFDGDGLSDVYWYRPG